MFKVVFRAGFAGLLVLVAPAEAAPYSDASSVRVQDFTGTVRITTGGSKVEVILEQGAKTHPVTLKVENGALVIRGEKRSWRFNIGPEVSGIWGDRKKAFERYLQNYPHLEITAPAGTDFTFEQAIARIDGGDLNSHVKIGGPWVEATLGDVKSADVGIGGPGDTTLGDVAETAQVAIGGSGDFRAGDVGRAKFTIGGSGDITTERVGGAATISIGGSGDVMTKGIGGGL
ncbi:MAG TPA: DUF2807 domain-containing protein, partial [Parvularculaceae bacterium]|nr:DUF2807 domain-containing protein [Parvularculaceae bacterium]